MRLLPTALVYLVAAGVFGDELPRIDRATERAERLERQIATVSAARLRPAPNAGVTCHVLSFVPVLYGPGEFATIQGAINSISPVCDIINVDPLIYFPLYSFDGHRFVPNPITIGKSFSESLTINRSLTIQATPGPVANAQAVIAMPPGFIGSIITINSSGSPAPVVHLNHLSIGGGAAASNGGGINNNGGVVFVDSCNITGNSAGLRGGGIYNGNVGAMMITNSYIANNFALLGGGAIANSSLTKISVSLMTIQNTTIEDNSATEIGGAIDQDFGITLIQDSTIRRNSCSTIIGAYGGAINNNLGGMSISRTTIIDNYVKSTLATPPIAGTAISAAGGAINNTGDLVDTSVGVMILNSVLIARNYAQALYGANGGAINNTAGGTVTMTDCTVLDNHAPSAGGLDNGLDGVVTITRSTFALNTVSSRLYAQGGALRNNDASVVIRDSAFVQNEAQGSGRGGAIYYVAKTQGSSMTIENSTFSGNVAKEGIGGQGGAVYVFASSGGLPGVSATIDVHNCTFANNDASSEGESFYILGDLASANVNFSNTILAGSRSTLPHKQPADPPGNYYSTNCKTSSLTGSAHFNTSGNNIDLDDTCGMQNGVNGDRSKTDPLLGPLALRGAATATHSLLIGSPAIDAVNGAGLLAGAFGTPLPADQRGIARPQNLLFDIGAYERVLGGLINYSPQFYPVPQSSVVTATLDHAPTFPPAAADAFIVRSEMRPRMQGSLSFNAAQNKVTFTPATPLPPNEVIRATVTANLKRDDGVALQNPTQWWFEAQGPAWCVGGWTQRQDLALSILGSVVAFGDYDGDGDLDLVATATGLGAAVTDVYRNDAGTFVPIGTGLPNLERASVAWSDIDNDGDLDLAILGERTVALGTFIDGYAEIFRNDGGTFVPVQAGLPQFSSGGIAFGDYDNDGKADLFISGYEPLGAGTGQTMSKLYHNEGNGTFHEVAGPASTSFVKAAWGDYDNDGFLDLAVAGYYGEVAAIYHNDGAGHLASPIGLTNAVHFGRLSWGDYDNDGRLDLLIGGLQTDTPVVTLYHNNLNNTFTPVAAPFAATSDGDQAFVDFDNDGKLDVSIAGTSFGASILKLYRNGGGGVFTEVPTTLPGAGTASMSWGDFDGDGHVDLALTGFSGTWFRKVYHHDQCTAVNDTYAATSGTPLVVPAAIGLLVNDQALGAVTAIRDTNAVHGTVSVNADGSFTYNPPVGSIGPDTFTYHVIDASGGSSNIATVTINVSGSGSACSTTVDGIFGWTSADSSAVQLAIDSASAGATVKIAGTCTGVQTVSGSTQLALITKSLTLRGGYLSSNWSLSDPVAYPTTLDAGATTGRVVLATGASTSVTLDSLRMLNGRSTTTGGGIDAAGPLTVAKSTISGSTATVSGGGIQAAGALTISQSLINGNGAPGGAGIFAAGPTLDLRNTTIHSNSGSTGGGGLHIAGGTATINNVTISQNSGLNGAITVASGSATIRNSILASNTPNCGGAITSGGFNVSSDATCVGGTGDLATTNANLNALGSYGGPTQTRSLPQGSPAIDLASATCEAVDQRGIARPAALGCDAGAYEAPDFRSCNAKVVSSGTVFLGPASDANAIRQAISAAAGTDQILLAGNCIGLFDFGGFTAMGLVAGKTLTFSGGYNPLNFSNYDPVAFPTVLDGTPGALANGPIFRVASNGGHVFNDINFVNARLRAINMDGSGGGTFNRCNFTANSSNDGAQGGGAIHIDGGLVTFNDSTFTGNSSTSISQGGVIVSFGNVVVNRSTFTGNLVSGGISGFGGAMAVIGSISITDSTFTGNRAANRGGAINAFGPTTITRSTFSGNQVTTNGGDGGGAVWYSSSLTVDGSTFNGNSTASSGGALYQAGFTAPPSSIRTSTFTNNTASANGFGGAIGNFAGSLTITDSTLANNRAGGGGGILNWGSTLFDRCLIDGNSTNSPFGSGGGVYNISGGMTLRNSTIRNNSGTFGAIENASSMTIVGCTITGNRSNTNFLPALSGGGSPMQISNTIISNNRDGGNNLRNCGSVNNGSSAGYNISDDATCFFVAPTDRASINPLLGPFQSNGGPTFTYDLLPGSPALDTGDCAGNTIFVDQRSFARPHGSACDVGAVEHKGIDTTTLLASSLPSSVIGQSVMFTATVSAATGPAPTGNVVFKDGGSPIATIPLTGGVAVFTTSSLSLFGHDISASFVATTTHDASTSATITIGVAKASTSIAVVAATPEPSGTGAAVTIKFALNVVAPGSGIPSGSVTVSDGTQVCTAILPATSCNLSFATAGPYLLSATYPGDANFNASESPSLLTHNVVDAQPPKVNVANSVADTGDAVLNEGEVVTVPVTQLLLKFSKPMNVASAQTLANYALVTRPAGTPVTTGCTILGAGDVALPVEAVFYDAATTTATVGVQTPLPFGTYRLIACATLADVDARALDGNGDGTGGDNFIRNFSVNAPPRVTINAIAEADIVRVAVPQLVAKFDQPMNAGETTTAANYLLVRAGPNNVVNTVSCAAGVASDDVRVNASGVSLLGNDATLTFAAPLADSRYRLIVCNSIHGTTGAALDGNSDTVAGDDFTLNFVVDLNPPAGTTLISTTHTAAAWSKINTINMQWSGTTDAVGVAGYADRLDTIAATDPGSSITIVQGIDPHNRSNGPLADGSSYYFHLRACDVDANCAAPLHRGPYMIDTLAPTAPSALVSSSHTVNVPGFAPSIAMSWTAAVDALSGVAGYGYAFDANPAWVCDQVNRITATNVVSAPLAPGTWYFHTCATDLAGNWSPVATSGPYLIAVSTIPHVVTATFTEGQAVNASVAQLNITFDQDVIGAGTVANYLLVSAGPNGTFETLSVAGGRAGDDAAIAINTATYNALAFTVALNVNAGVLLGDGRYRLIASNNIQNAGTVHLDGDLDGIAGDDFVRNFIIDTTAPSDPVTTISTTHTANVWSKITTIGMQWSGAADNLGLAGYSVLFDHTAATLPDTTIEKPHTTDPHSFSSAASLPDGVYYFHLRTCDLAGNCTTTVHAGPYDIDATPPAAPTGIAGTVATNTISVSWTAAVDALSGIAGYGYAFDANATWPCDQVNRVTATNVTSAALAPGSWYFHICAADIAGNWSPVATSAPFTIGIIDTTPPTDPTTTTSTTHTANVWSKITTIVVQWSGAADNNALAGYSVLFDHSPATLPDTTIDVPQATDPHSFSSGPLPDGIYYFHLRTCDASGNCTSTVHAGPYEIDTAAPAAPGGINVVGAGRTLGSSWNAVNDPLSGIAGYAYSFDQNATWPCDQVNRLTATSVTSPLLLPGNWYFHVCAVDAAGNWSPSANAGPFPLSAAVDIPTLDPRTLLFLGLALAALGFVLIRR